MKISSFKFCFDILEIVTGTTIQITSTSLCEKCTLMLNYHDKFSLKVKSIQDKLNSLMAPKYEDPDEDLKIEKVEISDDDVKETRQKSSGPKTFTCYICQKTFENKLAYKVHKKMHSFTKNEDFMCEHCGETFLTSSNFTNHKKKCMQQNMFGPFKCEVEDCEREFDSWERLRLHKNYHSQRKREIAMVKEPCEYCGKEFTPGYRMTRHMKFHTKHKEHSCPCCSSRYTQRYNLLAHMKQHHPDVYQEVANDVKSRAVRNSLTFLCPYCSENFNKIDLFREHYEQTHGIFQPSTSHNE